MDRESRYVTDGNYKVVVVAYDNGKGWIFRPLGVSPLMNPK